MLKIGDKAPDFSSVDDKGKSVKLSDFKGNRVVLYFYPKDNTPGCTKEACSLRDSNAIFKKKKIKVLGVSPDSEASHQKFIAKFDLPFTLISDKDHKVAELYESWGKKKFMGREYMGVLRRTFLIDEKGKIVHIFDKVDVAGHAEEVLAAFEAK
jgi:peroxiredoxin Q/BCP